jgi:hypothetical protein
MKTKIFLIAALVLTLNAATQAQTLPSYLPTDGLVGWWPFNGNAADESGNGNDGTVNGATLSSDRFGNSDQAFNFDGINDRIKIPFDLSYTNDTGSISLWMYATSLPSTNDPQDCLFGKGWGYPQLVYRSNSNVFIQIANSTSSFPSVGTQSNISNNEWKHIIAIYEGASLQIYIDGTLNNSQILTPMPNYYSYCNSEFWIGGFRHQNSCMPNDSVQFFQGKIDELAFYNRALTQEEITALYTGEPVNPPTACNPLPANLQNGLVGYWPFCGNANDESGNGNDGTVNGATLTEDRFGVANSAYDFDGVDDWILIEDHPSLRLEKGTVSAFVKYSSQNKMLLIAKQDLQNPFEYISNYAIEINDYGNNLIGPRILGMYAENCISNPTNWTILTSNNDLSNNEWHYVTSVYDSSEIKLYIDGNFIESILTESPFMNGCDSTELLLGRGWNDFPLWYDGAIDDIGIWNRALSADEVQQLYTLNACTFTVYDTVTVTQTVYDTVTTYTSVTDTLIINTLITSVEPAQENTFLVYPNPASTQITINNGNVGILGGYTMRITNSAGQEVYNQNITQAEVTLDLSNWGGNGLYILYINDPSNNTIAVKQIILQ